MLVSLPWVSRSLLETQPVADCCSVGERKNSKILWRRLSSLLFRSVLCLDGGVKCEVRFGHTLITWELQMLIFLWEILPEDCAVFELAHLLEKYGSDQRITRFSWNVPADCIERP